MYIVFVVQFDVYVYIFFKNKRDIRKWKISEYNGFSKVSRFG